RRPADERSAMNAIIAIGFGRCRSRRLPGDVDLDVTAKNGRAAAGGRGHVLSASRPADEQIRAARRLVDPKWTLKPIGGEG
ncbi:MAG TPA: hypothetical protein VGI50_13690, partial [Solirubrobacteraceae bacterium]